MEYSQLKSLDRVEAIRMVEEAPPSREFRDNEIIQFPFFPDVIVYGNDYWSKNDLICKFIEDYVNPSTEREVSEFLQDITKRICIDPIMDGLETRNQLAAEYRLMYKAYMRLYSHPDSLSDWAEQKGTFIWFEHILSKKRNEQFLKIKKPQDNEKLRDVTDRIRKIYRFTDREIIYLHYFCSQTKLDDLDPSLNTMLYCWSNEKFTGKTTVASYICCFLNGEVKKEEIKNHKSKMSVEMQIGRFDMPSAITSRCTFMDEAGFHDMTKTYDTFKDIITSNSCEIEYKYKNSKRSKKCYRNYITASNKNPIYFVQDEEERRILSIEFKTPKQVGFAELEKLWYEFVLECNLSTIKLTQIYHEIIKPNSQSGESKNIMSEMMDIFSEQRMQGCNGPTTPYFSVSHVMMFPEVITQKLSRKLVKDVLSKLYGQPDASQRFYKRKRDASVEVEPDEIIEMPF